MPTTPALFSREDLADFLQKDVSAAAAASVERIVWGWLKLPLGLTERPAPVPEEVFSWAIELAAIAHENPAGLSSYQLGPETLGFSAERRAAVLEEATSGGRPAGSVPSPRGSFPPAPSYPDPIRGW